MTVAQTFLDQVFRLHGMPASIVSDWDKIFLSTFWRELCRLQNISQNLSTAYQPQTDGQTEIVNRALGTYLRCMCSDTPKDWSRWIPLAEYWYNTSYHSAINTSPYEALYGQAPSTHIPYLSGSTHVDLVDRSLTAREEASKLLRFHLKRSKDRMKAQADKKRSDRNFDVGDWVYVKLQPYRQSSLVVRSSPKLSPKFFGPYKVLQRVGAVAYKLDLPVSSRIHSTFHVSQLKKHIGPVVTQSTLPLFDSKGLIAKCPIHILDRRMVKRGNKAATQLLVQWSDSDVAGATWELAFDLQKRFPNFDLAS